jgi:ATP-dependent helicase/nuclease subunit B
MPIQLLIAPSASGKTQACLDLLRARQRQNSLAPAWVLLPDRLQLRYFRQRLAPQGGLNVFVSTFEDLYRELLERAGKPTFIAPTPVLFQVLRRVVEDLHSKGELAYYAEIRQETGFYAALLERFAELRRSWVQPGDFLREADPAVPGQVELSHLYAEMVHLLSNLGWTDLDGLGWSAVTGLLDDPHLGSDLGLVIVDGFDDFTRLQVEILALLEKRLPKIFVTLPGTPTELSERTRLADSRFNTAHIRLENRLPVELISGISTGRLPTALRNLELGLFEPDQLPLNPDPAVSLLEVRSAAEEAREALRWIKAHWLRNSPAKPPQAAIFTPNPDLHLPFLKEAAFEFGMQLELTIPEPLAEIPSMLALLNLLSLHPLDFPRQETLETIRSPYFDLSGWGMPRSSAAELERLAYAHRLTGGITMWLDAFEQARLKPAREMLPELSSDAEAEAITAAANPPQVPTGERLARLADGFRVFFTEQLVGRSVQSLAAWINWLDELLEKTSFWDLAESFSRRTLAELLGALTLADQIGTSDILSYAQFYSEFLRALEGATFYPDIPASPGSILVSRLPGARGARFDLVTLLGMGEGVFPEVERPDPFLPEPLRQRLDLEPRLGRQQASLFYQAVTRPDTALLLTRPYLAEGGEAWEPSPYWAAVARRFPESVYRLRPENPRQLTNAASPAEYIYWVARHTELREPVQQHDNERYNLSERWANILSGAQILQARLAKIPRGPFEGYLETQQAALGERFNEKYFWSASQFEAYNTCPHQFFVNNTLRIAPLVPPEPGPDIAQLGSLLHRLLERAYREASDPGDPESVIAVLHTLAPTEFEHAPLDFDFRPGPLWETEQVEWLERLEQTILAIAELEQGWLPIAFEQKFGFAEQPPLTVPTSIGKVHLRGVIDRIDRCLSGELRVIDYKSGGSHQELKDLINGTRLQLPIYALAAKQLTGKQPVEGFYWNLRKAEPGRLHLSKFKVDEYPQGVPGALELALEYIDAALFGIHAGVFPPQPPEDGCPAYCPAAAWCWRYKPSPW